MRFRRSLLLVSLLVLATPALAGCFQPQTGPWSLTLNLGGIVAPSAGDGNDLRVAFQTAVTQLTTANVGLKINTYYETATGDDAAAAYDRLVARGAVAVVDLRGAAEAQALVAHASSAAVLLPALENATLGGVSYRLAPDAGAEAKALAALAQRVAAKRVAIVHTVDAYGSQVSTALAPLLANATDVPDRGDVGGAVCSAHVDAAILVMGPAEALRVLQFIQGAGCRASVKVLASTQAFGIEPNSPQDVSLVQGVLGAAPETARAALMRSILRSVDASTAPPFSAEAFDAVDAIAFAALASHGGAGKERLKIEGIVTASDITAHLARVLSAPGVKQQDLARAAEAVKAGDDIDWTSYAHDDDLSASTHAPVPGRYVEWATTADGSSEMRPDVLLS